ncbi:MULTISPECIES: AraC-like ligand-binding domain-containing protein [unclassified Streptomyces]|uniref:AraC-like ligand-binding domain-containing protein n=1 Tax=unclassified Streptomyces TaxID=2593676 RepID=UPI00225A3314|nr:helix-turn-helix domain-containing protein [Streptomyces sp. NBC_00340]MCX5134336.1 helix-turn-helix domain-containing protein [Streptomyces sp. NBC_00340]
MSTVLSTAPLSAAERTARWHEAVNRTFVPLDVELLEREPSPGSIVSHQLGPLRISTVQAGPQVVRRDRRLIARDSRETVILSLQNRGTAVKEQDGRESRIAPGGFSLSDSSRPFSKKLADGFSFTSFQFPRDELRVRDEDLRAVTATSFPGDEGTAALLAMYLAGTAREAAAFDHGVGGRVAATALDLLVLLIDERCGRFVPDAPEHAAASLVRVKEHVVRNLSDPDLSPSRIAEANFMSVRYVHKLFQLDGTTVGGWMRAQRLERCRRDLLRPRARDLGVAAIAHRWGFVSASHFSRAFRAAYGMAPRDWLATGGSEGRQTASEL